MIISAIQKPLELHVFGACSRIMWGLKSERDAAPFYLTEQQAADGLGRYRDDGRCYGTVLAVNRGQATLVVNAGGTKVECRGRLYTAALGHFQTRTILFAHEREADLMREALEVGERMLTSNPEVGHFTVDAIVNGTTYSCVSLASGDGDDWGFLSRPEAQIPTGC